jgi:hypothetical protein
MDVARLRARIVANVARLLAPMLVLATVAGCAFMGPTTATGFLKQVEHDPDPNVRFKAYRALGTDRVYDEPTQKREAAVVILRRLDPQKEPMASRAMICRTLGLIGDPIAREAMIRQLRDPDVMIRAEAIRALGKVGRSEDATVLMQAMKLDADPDCKVAAIDALGLLKSADPRTETYLVEAMEDDDPAIRLAAYGSIKRLTNKDLGAKPGPWRELVVGRSAAPLVEPTQPPRRYAIKNPFQSPDLGMKPKVARKVYTDPYKVAEGDPNPPTMDKAAQPAAGRRFTFTDPFKRQEEGPQLPPDEPPSNAGSRKLLNDSGATGGSSTSAPSEIAPALLGQPPVPPGAKAKGVYTDPFKRSEGAMWDPPAGVNASPPTVPTGP